VSIGLTMSKDEKVGYHIKMKIYNARLNVLG